MRKMTIPEFGRAVRDARNERGLTQAELARAAGLSRNTINRLENGLFPDLGIKKAAAILEKLGMELTIKPAERKSRKADFVAMASASANVSFKEELTTEELVHALLSGKVPAGKAAHFMVLLEEAPASLLKGLVGQVGALAKPGKVEKNLKQLARQIGLPEETSAWPEKIA